MRISTKTHLDSVRILELARSYFRLANPHPPLPTYTHTIYFTDEKTESLPVDISSYNSSACFEKKTRCENTRSRSTCGEDCRCLGKIFPSPYLSIFESLPVKHIYYFCKKKKKVGFTPTVNTLSIGRTRVVRGLPLSSLHRPGFRRIIKVRAAVQPSLPPVLVH